MKLLQTETLQDAREKLFEYMRALPETETVGLADAEGRVLAEEIRCGCDIPHFRRSTVDGYAVVSRDTQGAGESVPVFLKIVEEVSMGDTAKSVLESGQCAYVPTGGMLPEGADAVVMVEYCEAFDSARLAVYSSVSPGRNVVQIGEDAEAGSILLKKGALLRPQEIGALASAGCVCVPVFRPLRLTIISTGDELVPPESLPAPGQIRDVNTYALEALARKRGFETVSRLVLRDGEETLKSAVAEAMEISDIVAVSGGSSQGKKDFCAEVLDGLSNPGVFVHGISLKPGKPTILGYDEKSRTALVGLPGHPAAALLVFELIVVWVKNRLIAQAEARCVYANMGTNIVGAPGKTSCLTVRLFEKDGGYIAEPVLGKSGAMSALTAADGYVLIDINKEGLRKDELVKVLLF